MGRPAWQIKIVTLFWPMRNFLARMVGWPILGRVFSLAFRGDRASYIPVRVEVKPPGSAVIPTQAVEELIRKASYRFILDRCLCRSLESCRNYPRELGCLFLGEGAREIAPGLGREADPEEALTHHRRAIALGLIPMVGKLRWDSLWLGVKKADELVTICHCCDCCCYFKTLPSASCRGGQGSPETRGCEHRSGRRLRRVRGLYREVFHKGHDAQGWKSGPGRSVPGLRPLRRCLSEAGGEGGADE